jgi:hypothetical protein
VERQSVKRGDTFGLRTLHAPRPTLYALTLLVLRFGIAAGQIAERVRGMFVFV